MSGSHSFGVVSITVILVLFVYAVSGAFFEHKHFHLIHETGLGIILGALSGGLFYLLFHDTLYQLYNFNGTFFFYILLPIIIFCGGYNLNKRKFAQNFTYISLFGVLGTIVTFIFILTFTYLVNEYELITVTNTDEVIKFSMSNIMIFAATICASDSVAALTMIKPEKYPKLFSVVFGEGMVNDAVSIILFISVELFHGENQKWMMSLNLIVLFLKEFIGSLLIGWLIGLFTTYLFKRLRFLTDNVILEICIILYMGYASFAICELLELSGVISVLVCGVVLSHYNFYNLCNIGQISSKVTLNSLSLLCESFIYVYLGLALWAIPGDEAKGRDTMKTSIVFVLLQIAICFVSRGLSIFILTMITQIFTGRKNFALTFWELNIVWFAGLIRGSVAYALIQKLSYEDDNIDEKNQIQVMQTTVLIMVVSTTIVLGGLMPVYIVQNLKFQEHRIQKKKNLKLNKVSDSESIRVTFLGEIHGGIGEQGESKVKKQQHSKFYKFLLHIEEHYLKQWLIFKYNERKQDIKQLKQITNKPHDNQPRRQTVTFAPLNVRQESMGQGIHQHRQSKAVFRSTMNTKYTGVQDLVMMIDLPEDEIIYSKEEEELRTQIQVNDNDVIREVKEENDELEKSEQK